MKELLKDYGPATGPAFAFLLGIVALIVKELIDRATSRGRAATLLSRIAQMVRDAEIPTLVVLRRDPAASGRYLFIADAARNMTAIAHFYATLKAIKGLATSSESLINTAGSVATIRKYYETRWWFDIVLTEIEEIRKRGEPPSRDADWDNLTDSWKRAKSAAEGRKTLN